MFMKKVVLKPKSMSRFTLHCPFTNEELDNGGGHTYIGPVENLISSLLGDESA